MEGHGAAEGSLDEALKGTNTREASTCCLLLPPTCLDLCASYSSSEMSSVSCWDLLMKTVLFIPRLFHSPKYPPYILLAGGVRLVGCKVALPCHVWKAGLNWEAVYRKVWMWWDTNTEIPIQLQRRNTLSAPQGSSLGKPLGNPKEESAKHWGLLSLSFSICSHIEILKRIHLFKERDL